MVSRAFRMVVFGAALSSLSLSAPLRAATSPGDKARARRLVKRGQGLVVQRRYSEALRMFRKAFSIWPRPEIRFNVALVCYQMGRFLEAHRALRLYLRRVPAQERARLPPFLRNLLRRFGVLDVSASPPDVSIYINGVLAGQGHVSRSVVPGRLVVTFLRDGSKIGGRAVRVRAGQTVRSRFQYVPPPRRAAPARVRPSGLPHPRRARRIQRTDRSKLHWGWVAAATCVTAVSAGFLVGFGLKTNELEERFHVAPTPELQSRGRRYLAITNTLVGVTVAAGLTAAVFALFTRWHLQERAAAHRAAAVTPMVSPGGAALQVRW